jgi:hypothetical protein
MHPLALDVLAFLLVLFAIGNVYFVWDGFRLWRASDGKSGILRALFVAKLLVWGVGVFVAIVSARYLLDLEPLPFSGLGLGIVLLVVELLPAYIHIEMHRIARDDDG